MNPLLCGAGQPHDAPGSAMTWSSQATGFRVEHLGRRMSQMLDLRSWAA
jgi:hypothetical protein